MIGYIDNETMKSWLNGRYRNYSNDNLAIMNEKKEIKITYKEIWDKLNQDNYFEKDDPYIKFMNHAHANEIEEAMDMKKEL